MRIEQARDVFENGFRVVEPPPVPGGKLIRCLPDWLPGVVRSLGTKVALPWSRSRIQHFQHLTPLRLHMGCGWDYKEGWVNIDLFMTRADLVWDLSHGIPFERESVEAIFHEHMFEHLTLQQGYALAKESLRVLRPGGIQRIGVPDAGACIASYAGLGDSDWAASQPSGLLAVQRLFYMPGHVAMYDAETLTLICRAAGFRSARAREWGDSDLDPSPDTPDREGGTLYVEAIK
jgi:predicted SAM-dependent methyltransferase